MKAKLLLLFMLLAIHMTGFSTIWIVNNSGTSFSPATITINAGDTVNFVISSAHDAREVSQTTWSANGNTVLPGGFQTPFGGGMVLPAKLGEGTHYYVCTPHAGFGMKGVIIVQSPTGISQDYRQKKFSLYPNPSDGKFQVTIDGSQFAQKSSLTIYNMVGEKVYSAKNLEQQTPNDVDLSGFPKGIYIVKVYDGLAYSNKKILVQ